jgi:hypothetical protein
MKKILLVVGLLAACGGMQEPEDTRPQICTMEMETGSEECRDATDEEIDGMDVVDVVGEDGEEIGRAGQFLTVDQGFGSEAGASTRECIVPWDGNRCLLMKDRTLKMNVNCTSNKTGACTAINDAANDWRAFLNARGWTVSFVSPGTSGLDTPVTTNVVGTSTDTLLGISSVSYNTGEQVAGPGGNYERVFLCAVELDIDELYTALTSRRDIYATVPTDAQKANSYYNLATHEFGHCIAYGHHSVGNVMSSEWPDMFSRRTYATFQGTWANNYRAF